MSLTLRTSCLATAYTLSTFSSKMALAQGDATVEVTEAPEDTDAVLPLPSPYTGAPVPEIPTLTGVLVNPEDQTVGKIRENLADQLGVDKEQITVNTFDPITGAIEFTITGDNAQTAGQQYLSLPDEALVAIGLKAGSSGLGGSASERSIEESNDGLWWKVLLGVLAGLLALCLCCALAFFFLKRKKQDEEEEEEKKRAVDAMPAILPPGAMQSIALYPSHMNNMSLDNSDADLIGSEPNSDLDLLMPFQNMGSGMWRADSDLDLL